jgi:hypothetical protein
MPTLLRWRNGVIVLNNKFFGANTHQDYRLILRASERRIFREEYG